MLEIQQAGNMSTVTVIIIDITAVISLLDR